MQDLKCCILIPTFNNEKTLSTVIEDVLNFTSNVIVINDGSTDSTHNILQRFNFLELIEFPKNRGKGAALREGFKTSERLGFEYAIAIDSDGQLFASDIPSFLEFLCNKKTKRPILLIGGRSMNQPSIPGKSKIGNKFSSLSFWLQTGVRLKDTQCGFRLYPLKLVNHLDLKSTGYDLEIEVIVKAAWAGAKIENVPVKVLYDKKERVSHFKPWADTFRIINLNFKLAAERLKSKF